MMKDQESGEKEERRHLGSWKAREKEVEERIRWSSGSLGGKNKEGGNTPAR
jgi:hypothetical protein